VLETAANRRGLLEWPSRRWLCKTLLPNIHSSEHEVQGNSVLLAATGDQDQPLRFPAGGYRALGIVDNR